MDAWLGGVISVAMSTCILVVAWGIGDAITDIHTARALMSLMGDSVPAGLVPTLVFGMLLMSVPLGHRWGEGQDGQRNARFWFANLRGLPPWGGKVGYDGPSARGY